MRKINTHIDRILTMIKTLTALPLILTLTACSMLDSKESSSDLISPALLNEAQPLYEACLKDYQQTMSNEDAKKFCTDKVKEKAVKTLM